MLLTEPNIALIIHHMIIITASWHGSTSGPWFNIKMSSYQYRKSRCGDKMVIRSFYLHNGISYIGKMASLYWINPQVWNEPTIPWWILHINGQQCITLVFSLLWAWTSRWTNSQVISSCDIAVIDVVGFTKLDTKCIKTLNIKWCLHWNNWLANSKLIAI